ncbi:predicted protein [Nematostella vectensis]|uniref:SGF29 C-terminal domain-containing protein n=1 Tax=Nematostella vectensis TaxID=45351 RepID=A7RLY8_NEMVE|nr:predicted protein [Nematostella vectensis]|eukprot:XP_001639477.1 predicted protein [Nematostella vectensis]
MKTEGKVSSYFKTKLRGLYKTAMSDAEAEADIIRKTLDKIAIIKALRSDRRSARGGMSSGQGYQDTGEPRKAMRRGVLMTMLQQAASQLPMMIGKSSESDISLASFNTPPCHRYDVDDIDEEGKNGKERHHLSRRRVVPLPKMKANPQTHPNALFKKDQVVMALYPQTTCFYKAWIHEPPTRPQDHYSVSFEDTSYADGFAPPLHVPQRYVVVVKETKRR